MLHKKILLTILILTLLTKRYLHYLQYDAYNTILTLLTINKLLKKIENLHCKCYEKLDTNVSYLTYRSCEFLVKPPKPVMYCTCISYHLDLINEMMIYNNDNKCFYVCYTKY